ncbi:MAG: vitamin K epoxide reductase family protein [Acidobacteriaceae bacterium]
MRSLIFLLAVAGIVVSSLAWQIHYSNKVEPCDINAHWDCGIVNHSRYSMIKGVPVAAVGVAGYLMIALLALFRKRKWTLVFALLGFGFALYLSHIEAFILEVWCLYCVISQVIIALIAIVAAIDLASRFRSPSGTARAR